MDSHEPPKRNGCSKVKLISPSRLRQLGFIGMNRRNTQYIAGFNARHHYPLVDNKLKTKLLAQQAGIAVPDLLGVVEYQFQVKELHTLLEQHQQFVVKPAKGSGGKGILVIASRDHEVFFKPSHDSLSLQHIERHVSNILSGLHSLGGTPDVAMIERMIQMDPVFNDYSYEGIPDIRVIVFQGYPVMAMLRLATHASDGKANLHQGAVGVGLDMANGQATHAVQNDHAVFAHPDTGTGFDALKVPHWATILELAAACYELTGLGYIGVDLVLDQFKGPEIIELNARPGLAIQVANGCGLQPRLDLIERQAEVTLNPSARAQFSASAFAGVDAGSSPA